MSTPTAPQQPTSGCKRRWLNLVRSQTASIPEGRWSAACRPAWAVDSFYGRLCGQPPLRPPHAGGGGWACRRLPDGLLRLWMPPPPPFQRHAASLATPMDTHDIRRHSPRPLRHGVLYQWKRGHVLGMGSIGGGGQRLCRWLRLWQQRGRWWQTGRGPGLWGTVVAPEIWAPDGLPGGRGWKVLVGDIVSEIDVVCGIVDSRSTWILTSLVPRLIASDPAQPARDRRQ